MIQARYGSHSTCCILAFLFLQSGCPELSAQDLIKQPGTTSESPETSPSSGITLLRQIEDRVLPLPLVPGVPRHESLPDYYWETNVALKYRLDEAVRAFNTGRPSPYRAMTVVAGSAGVGKTFVKASVYHDSIPEDQVWKFDIRELFAEMASQGLAVAQPDVHHRDQVISRLLSLTDEGREAFMQKLEQRSPAFVVVDSLDEVHPDDYLFVLNALERFALQGDRKFIHVVIFGRPLAFHDYWRIRQSEGLPHGLRAYVLNPPDFRTTGDLLVSSWNYDCWKYRLARQNSKGQTQSMTFPDFQRWCECDFVTTGEFADVKFDQNKSLCPSVRDELQRWAQQHRVVVAVLPNLAGNSIVREIVEAHVENERSFNEREFMDEFFASWLERNTKSGDRPSRLKPGLLELYVKLLEAVAAKYVDQHRVDRLGYFDVLEQDQVVVQHDGESVSVSVRSLLNHSGVVTLDPVLPVAQRYRFEPVWVHRLLLQMHHERGQE